jgi:hypothetical protein
VFVSRRLTTTEAALMALPARRGAQDVATRMEEFNLLSCPSLGWRSLADAGRGHRPDSATGSSSLLFNQHAPRTPRVKGTQASKTRATALRARAAVIHRASAPIEASRFSVKTTAGWCNAAGARVCSGFNVAGPAFCACRSRRACRSQGEGDAICIRLLQPVSLPVSHARAKRRWARSRSRATPRPRANNAPRLEQPSAPPKVHAC